MNVQNSSESLPAGSMKRRAVVLIAVLFVIVLLSLAGYQYADLMLSEYRASESAHRAIQAQKFADSGIYYAAGLLSNVNNFTNMLNSNPWNNPQMFDEIEVPLNDSQSGYFKVMAPPNIDDTSAIATYLPGVQDESGKINLNAWMLLDPTGQTLYNALMMLPNMTQQIAYNIITWMGGSYGVNNGGMGDSYYMGLTNPYHAKYGPIDSIDELLLVQGVTWDLLYGSDLNRNGVQEDGELGVNGFWRGWSAYLTVHSREQNYDSTGTPYIYLNNADLQQLYGFLQQANIGDDLAKFIIMYRQYGGSTSSGSSQSLLGSLASMLGGGGGGGGNGGTVKGTLASYSLQFTKAGNNQITSMFALCTASVSISSVDPTTKKTITTVYASPISTATGQQEYLPNLFLACSLTSGTEILPRVNINTASSVVLSALPGLQATDVTNIMTARPDIYSGDSITPDSTFATPAWLMTSANLSAKQLQQLEPYVTTRSQVYRVQSVGYFKRDGNIDTKGPRIRVEAVIDTSCPNPASPNAISTGVSTGLPRILAWRTLSELGNGISVTMGTGQ